MGGNRRKENQLHLVVSYMDTECEIIISPSKDIPAIYAELKKLMLKQTQKPVQMQLESQLQTDVSSALERLHGLLEKGILGQGEFDAPMKKLLA
jgi:hypothetical protein